MSYPFLRIRPKQKKALFIIADGIPADVIERVATPAIDEISAKGGYTRAYMGGEAGGITHTPTVSAVCYNSLLTSTWLNKHNVNNNNVDAPNYNYWNIFRIAKNQKQDVKTAIFSSWEDNRTKLVGEKKTEAGNIQIDFHLDGLEKDKINYPEEANSLQIYKIDEKISAAAAECIKENAPDLMWVYLWYMDAAGHALGDSDFFDQYTTLTDRQIARLWEAVKFREENYNEEWLIIVTTDHGRTAGNGKGHGGQSERERTIWISTNHVNTNEYFKKHQPGIVDIVPSICAYMGFSIPLDLTYEQEGISFLSPLSISNVRAKEENEEILITWDNYDEKPVDIYVAHTDNFKNGGADTWEKAGTVNAKEKRFVYRKPDKRKNGGFFKFSIRGEKNMMPAIISSQKRS